MEHGFMKTLKLILLTCSLTHLLTYSAHAQGAWTRENHAAEGVAYPRVLSVSNLAVEIFGTNTSDQAGATTSGRVLRRYIQNNGTNPLYYILKGTNNFTGLQPSGAVLTNISVTNYHGIIPCGTAVRNGQGGTLDLSYWRWSVYVSVPTNSAGATNMTEISVLELTQ